MGDQIPHGDMDLQGWSAHLVAAVSQEPSAWGQAAWQVAEYEAAQRAYAEALRVALHTATRTSSAIAAKDAARARLITLSRQTVARVQAHPGTTDEMRVRVRITVRKRRVKAVAVTMQRPQVRVESVWGRRITLSIRPGEGNRGARPRGVKGYSLYWAVGATVPTDLKRWTFEGNGIDAEMTVVLPGDLEPRTRVWFAATWLNNRMQPGPVGEPAEARVGFEFTGVAA